MPTKSQQSYIPHTEASNLLSQYRKYYSNLESTYEVTVKAR